MSKQQSKTKSSSDGLSGVEIIARERARQISEEGWTPEHDDEHGGNEMVRAAVGYAKHAYSRGWICGSYPDGSDRYTQEPAPDEWPDEWKDYWKPTSPIRDLVKAGALIAAEIDRMLRAQNKTENSYSAEKIP